MTSSTPYVPPAIDTALAQLPVPMVVIQLPAGTYIKGNPAWHALFGGQTLEQIVSADDIDGVRMLLDAVSNRRLDGYVRRGHFHTAQGKDVVGHVSLQRLKMADSPDLAVTVLTRADQAGVEPPAWTGFVGEIADLGVVVTDHDWRIEHVSHDLEGRLGYDVRSIIGSALLGLLHPRDAVKLLQAIDRAVMSRHTSIARLRLRMQDGSWRELLCFITTLCEHDPPRLAVLLSGLDSAPTTTESARAEDLEQRLWRIAMEVRTAGLIRDAGAALPAHRTLGSAELSGRQWEIVTRLVNGQRVPDIARSMYLSPSTVRNHLTAVYRKFGVHSQQQLVALLTSSARPPG